MKRTTADGTETLLDRRTGETYHSHHGAWTEACHVFAEPAMHAAVDGTLRIFEVGFGTGLNFLATHHFCQQGQIALIYTAIDHSPPRWVQIRDLQRPPELRRTSIEILSNLLSQTRPPYREVADGVELNMLRQDATELLDKFAERQPGTFDAIYWDAFSPSTDPQLWEKALLTAGQRLLRSGGIFLTYCAKGAVRRDLERIGFRVQRRPGPPRGKRHVTLAIKSV